MLRNAFLKGLRDQLRPFVMWAAGVAFYMALLISIYPSIRKSAGAINEYVQNMPEAVRVAFMGSSDFTTPVGYVNVELLSWLAPIVLIAFAVAVAARSLAGEEESGTLGLVLTHAVGRRRFALQKYAAMTVVVIALGATFWLSLTVATAIAGIAAGAGVGVVMYLLNTLAVMNETIRPLRYVSLFHWAGGTSPLGKPLDATAVLVPVATSAVLLVATLALFERRDVRV